MNARQMRSNFIKAIGYTTFAIPRVALGNNRRSGVLLIFTRVLSLTPLTS